ncbi:hypothetical protein [uncultured Chryseobacterium sp.]|jgi:hypothetical protein|uniref:hypothetical protein n=1 Tax=uncultured Chryseobacterium sp. TaxID=259322 RepID=UPI002638E5C8|nr:hypothetical protein [uncultured Chryseobacterium sp.]
MNRENWIKIGKEAFISNDESDINSLLSTLIWRPKDSIIRYNFFVDIAPNKIIDVVNYQNLPQINRAKLIEQYKAAVISGKYKKFKYLVTKKDYYQRHEFDVSQAIKFFSRPVSLLLENGRNDAYFLKAIFKYFDKDVVGKKRLSEFAKYGYLNFDNAGGWTNINNVIEGQKESLEEFCAEIGRDPIDFIRCFVLLDSDRECIEPILEAKIRLKEKLENMGIEVHILNKRAMENYMPDEIVDDEATRNAVVNTWNNVYKTLSNEQKDYLNYPKGFPKDGGISKARNLQKEGIKNLYSNPPISDINYNVLDQGIRYPNFKENFPKKFNSPLTYRDNLLKREGGTIDKNEFLEIIDKINKLL